MVSHACRGTHRRPPAPASGEQAIRRGPVGRPRPWPRRRRRGSPSTPPSGRRPSPTRGLVSEPFVTPADALQHADHAIHKEVHETQKNDREIQKESEIALRHLLPVENREKANLKQGISTTNFVASSNLRSQSPAAAAQSSLSSRFIEIGMTTKETETEFSYAVNVLAGIPSEPQARDSQGRGANDGYAQADELVSLNLPGSGGGYASIIEEIKNEFKYEAPILTQGSNDKTSALKETINIRIDLNDFNKISEYVGKNRDKLMAQIQNLSKEKGDSLYLRKGVTKLPFTLQVTREGQIFIHMKKKGKELGKGLFKNVTVSVDFDKALPVANATAKLIKPEDREAALREARYAIQLGNKPGVIKVHTVHYYADRKIPQDQGQPLEKLNIITEYCNGGDLNAQMKKGNLNEADKNQIVYNALEGLVSFHDSGVVDCDLYPGNILVVTDPKTGRVIKAVISDFGLCRPKRTQLRTEADALFQNEYLPPEIPEIPRNRMDGFEHHGDKHDVYSLICTLYELIKGRLPPWIIRRRELMSEYKSDMASLNNVQSRKDNLLQKIPELQERLNYATSEIQNNLINKELTSLQKQLADTRIEIDELNSRKLRRKSEFASLTKMKEDFSESTEPSNPESVDHLISEMLKVDKPNAPRITARQALDKMRKLMGNRMRTG